MHTGPGFIILIWSWQLLVMCPPASTSTSLMRISLHQLMRIKKIYYLNLWKFVIKPMGRKHTCRWAKGSMSGLFWRITESRGCLCNFQKFWIKKKAERGSTLMRDLMGQNQPSAVETWPTRPPQGYRARSCGPSHWIMGHMGPTTWFVKYWGDVQNWNWRLRFLFSL